MALVNIDGVPLTQIGFPTRAGALVALSSNTVATLDATNEALITIGHMWTSDGGTHTIDTSGSSGLGWRTNNIAFANPATIVKVGLAAVDTANGPPGRAVNVGGVITFNVSRSLTGGSGGITGNLWQEPTPDAGTMTIANGDLVAFCIQMTNQGAADAINVGSIPQAYLNIGLPCVTSYLSGAYSNTAFLPNCRIRFSDGARGYFVGGALQNGGLSTFTWNSTGATKEYGNALTLPFPARISGLVAYGTLGGPTDFVLYSNPFVTPVAERTVSVSHRPLAVATACTMHILFPTPYEAGANQPLVLAAKPGVSNISMFSRLAPLNVDQDGDSGGEACFGVSRGATSFFSPLAFDRFTIGALVQAFAHPARSSHILGV